jgi:hypothetical protein
MGIMVSLLDWMGHGIGRIAKIGEDAVRRQKLRAFDPDNDFKVV